MSRPLLIDDNVKEAIRKLREAAATKPFPLASVQTNAIRETEDGNLKHRVTLADRRGKGVTTGAIDIPFGYHVHYGVEEQPAGLCGHLSISVNAKGKLPHPYAVEMIAQEFGMSIDGAALGWLEEFEPGHEAVNLLQVIGAPMTNTRN